MVAESQDEKWAQFDSEYYFQHYYGDPHPDDDAILASTCRALKAFAPGQALRTIDVGTGPNLYPAFAALPRASAITAWEYSDSNVAWLRAELQRATMREQWDHFWRVVRETYGPEHDLPDDPIPLLREKTTIRQGSIFDIPVGEWNAATMFFCAEAVSNVQSEFDRACKCFGQAVCSGGLLVAAFLVNSSSYVVGGRRYPVMTLTEDSLRNTFSMFADDIVTKEVGIVNEEVRSGYTGMVFLTARSRSI